MLQLEKEAKEAGITFMNQIPYTRLDHLYAVRAITKVHSAGGKITSLSYRGGLLPPRLRTILCRSFQLRKFLLLTHLTKVGAIKYFA